MKSIFFIPFYIFLLPVAVVAGLPVPNNGFENFSGSRGTKTEFWEKSGGDALIETSQEKPWQGSSCMKISSLKAESNYFYQDLEFKSGLVQKITIKAALRAKDLTGKAGLEVRIYDHDGYQISGFRAIEISTDQDWKIMSGIVYCDPTAASLKILGDLEGKGSVWFDEIVLEDIPYNTSPPSIALRNYLDEYFNLIRKKSVIEDSIRIIQIENNCLLLASGITSLDEAHDLLKRYATLKLNDKHSSFHSSAEWGKINRNSFDEAENNIQYPSGRMLKEHIAYIFVPGSNSHDVIPAQAYADTLQFIIKELDKQSPRGWIVDVSENKSDNCWPVIAGLGPLLGNGVCGYSFSGDGLVMTRLYQSGRAGWDSSIMLQVSDPYLPVLAPRALAVIYSPETSNSGEEAAIAFIGMPEAKSFGRPTSGTAVRIDNFKMSDGAILNLATGIYADRNGTRYAGALIPDVETENTEQAIQKAVEWIVEQN